MGAELRCPLLIGRDVEWAAVRHVLGEALDEAAGPRRGATMVLAGEAGVGKSRLAREAAARVAELGRPVLWGRSSPGGAPVPFRPVVELVAAALRALPDAGPRPDLDPFRPALARLVPTAGAAPSPDSSVVVLAEGVLRLLCCVGGLAVCEDLHWADAETLTLVEYLADHLSDAPVALLLTLRADETTPAGELIRALAGRGSAQLVELSRLDRAAAGRMAAACLRLPAGSPPPAPVAELVARSADGLPLLVEDLLAAAARDGGLVDTDRGWEVTRALEPGLPLTFSDTVRHRMDGLGSLGVQVLRAAAVLGRRFRWDLLAPVTGLEDAVVLDGLRAGAAVGLIVADADGFAFRHALTVSAVLDGLLPPERAALSRRAADVLQTAEPDLAGASCVLAADLRAAAGEPAAAARLLLRAGRRALADGALAAGAELLERAADLAAEPELAAEVGLAADLAAEPELAAEVGLALLEAVAATGDPDRTELIGQAALVTSRASSQNEVTVRLLMARGQLAASPARAAGHLAEARIAARGSRVDIARVDALEALAMLQSDRPDRAEVAGRLAHRAVAMAEASGLHEIACEALEVIGRCARVSDLDAAEAAFARQLQVATVGRLELRRIRAQNELGTMDWLRHGDPRGVQQAHDAAVSAGALVLAAGYEIDLAFFHAVLGDHPRSLGLARRCEATARRFGIPPLADAAVVAQAVVAAHRGRRAEMEDQIERIGEAAAGDLAVAVWGICHAMLALLEEDRPAALAAFERAEEAMRRVPALAGNTYAGMWLVTRLVEGTAGEADLVDLDAHARGTMLHTLTGGVAKAIVAGRAGRARQAVGLLAEGVAVTQPVLYRHLLLRLAAEAALVDGWGDPAAWLLEAEAWFLAHGHERSTAACRRLLRRAGVTVGRGGPAEAEVPGELRRLGVTAREAEVLGLLAGRLTNREIGAALFLSPRTVEKHVASLRGKLGAASRSELMGRRAGPDG